MSLEVVENNSTLEVRRPGDIPTISISEDKPIKIIDSTVKVDVSFDSMIEVHLDDKNSV